MFCKLKKSSCQAEFSWQVLVKFSVLKQSNELLNSSKLRKNLANRKSKSCRGEIIHLGGFRAETFHDMYLINFCAAGGKKNSSSYLFLVKKISLFHPCWETMLCIFAKVNQSKVVFYIFTSSVKIPEFPVAIWFSSHWQYLWNRIIPGVLSQMRNSWTWISLWDLLRVN